MEMELEIEELRLHGFKRFDREKIAAAVQAELERLIAEEGLPSGLRNGSEIRMQGGSFSVPAGLGAKEAGEAVARQMYGRWRR